MVRSIRFRLTLWYVIALAFILVVFSVTVYESYKRRLTSEISRSLQSTAFEAERLFDPEAISTPLPRRPGLRNIYILTFNKPGRIVGASDNLASSAFDQRAVRKALTEGESSVVEARDANLGQLLVYTIPVAREGKVVGAVQSARSLDAFHESLADLRRSLYILVPISLALAAAVGLFMSTKALSPIDEITRTTRRISATNLDERVPVSSRDELGYLAETINALLSRLEIAMEKELRFIADASHELRTPLTALKGEIEVALARDRNEAEYREILAQTSGQVDEMTSLVEGLLTLARLESGGSLELGDVDLRELLERVIHEAHRLHAIAGQALPGSRAFAAIELRADGVLFLRGDELKLKRLFFNLIENAVKFSPPGEIITVEASRAENEMIVVVRDKGPGIAAEELPRIFDRFYRGSLARSGVSGSGIGLSVAKLISDAHGGSISVESKPGVGSAFVVRLPSTSA